ncbi:MAG: NADH:ubiquinone reductase (Na(+)-transporting) subunit C [Cyclobacteriaceae bacterium]|nr:NADH:ubiquinone reductase (Na(+)-transporting) subunit C [Cyclobacteriaceae bacterium]
MQRSNTYILVFTAIMTVIIGGILSFTSQVLGPAQKKSIELDTKTQILSAVMNINKKEDVLGIYKKSIKSMVVDINGDVITKDKKGNPIVAEQVDLVKNYKMKPADREYPVYEYKNPSDTSKVEAYILPVYGAGLWNAIYGYVALESDLNTIKGVSFGHVSETPGLGARIATKEIEDRYKGKTIFDNKGDLVSVTMQKGEKKDPALFGPHQVDGMSGATLTGRGLNAMLKNYLGDYEAFIKKNQQHQ